MESQTITEATAVEIREKLMDAEVILMYLAKGEELVGQDSPEVLLSALATKARDLVAGASGDLEPFAGV